MAYKTINPYTNEVEHEYPQDTAAEVEKALTAAHRLTCDGAAAVSWQSGNRSSRAWGNCSATGNTSWERSSRTIWGS